MTPSQSKMKTSTLSNNSGLGSESFNTFAFRQVEELPNFLVTDSCARKNAGLATRDVRGAKAVTDENVEKRVLSATVPSFILINRDGLLQYKTVQNSVLQKYRTQYYFFSEKIESTK